MTTPSHLNLHAHMGLNGIWVDFISQPLAAEGVLRWIGTLSLLNYFNCCSIQAAAALFPVVIAKK